MLSYKTLNNTILWSYGRDLKHYTMEWILIPLLKAPFPQGQLIEENIPLAPGVDPGMIHKGDRAKRANL
jgi:hypothetical protein